MSEEMSLAKMATMSLQEIFDFAVNHLRTQGVPSTGPDGQCLYRGPNGTKCAFGAFISDTEYEADMEGMTVFTLARQKQWGYDASKLALLRDLQSAHDDSANSCVWARRLETEFAYIANVFGLVYTAPEGGV